MNGLTVQEIVIDGEQVINLKKPLIYDGTEYKSLTINFEELTGQDLLDAEREIIVTDRNIAPVKEFDKGYLSVVVAKAAKVPTEMVRLLGAKDFSKLTIEAQNFLMNEE